MLDKKFYSISFVIQKVQELIPQWLKYGNTNYKLDIHDTYWIIYQKK